MTGYQQAAPARPVRRTWAEQTSASDQDRKRAAGYDCAISSVMGGGLAVAYLAATGDPFATVHGIRIAPWIALGVALMTGVAHVALVHASNRTTD